MWHTPQTRLPILAILVLNGESVPGSGSRPSIEISIIGQVKDIRGNVQSLQSREASSQFSEKCLATTLELAELIVESAEEIWQPELSGGLVRHSQENETLPDS
jgi:hypothetical protein